MLLFRNIVLTYFDHYEEAGFSWFHFEAFLYSLPSTLSLSFLGEGRLPQVTGSLSSSLL